MTEQAGVHAPEKKRLWTSKNVKLATTNAEKEAIYRLRYGVYVEEMGGAPRDMQGDAVKRQVRDEMDETAAHFYVAQKGRIVACLRNNLRRDGPFDHLIAKDPELASTLFHNLAAIVATRMRDSLEF